MHQTYTVHADLDTKPAQIQAGASYAAAYRYAISIMSDKKLIKHVNKKINGNEKMSITLFAYNENTPVQAYHMQVKQTIELITVTEDFQKCIT